MCPHLTAILRFGPEQSSEILVSFNMKALRFFLFSVLCACSAQPSLEELEDEALVSGDWSKVASYEQKLERTGSANELDCPRQTVAVCRESGLSSKCSCVPSKGRRTPALQ